MMEFRVRTIFRAKKTKHYFRIINDLRLPSEYPAFLLRSAIYKVTYNCILKRRELRVKYTRREEKKGNGDRVRIRRLSPILSATRITTI